MSHNSPVMLKTKNKKKKEESLFNFKYYLILLPLKKKTYISISNTYQIYKLMFNCT